MSLQQQIIEALANERPITLGGTHTISETLYIEPPIGSQQRLNISADNAKIVWAGPPDTPMIYASGWKNSVIQGLHLDTGNAPGVVGWALGSPNNAPSSSGLTFINCTVNFGSGGGCIGWQASKDGDLYGDVSALTFINCMVRGLSRDNGDMGWQALRRNNLAWTWIGGGASRLKHIFSNRNPDGGAQHGGGSMSFYSLVATENACDFDFYAPGVFLISGGRYETGQRFLQLGAGGASFGASVKMDAVNVASYTPADGVLIYLGAAVSFGADQCYFTRFGGGDLDTRMITANAAASSYGSIRLSGGGVQADAWRTIQSGQWQATAAGVARLSSASGAMGWINA